MDIYIHIYICTHMYIYIKGCPEPTQVTMREESRWLGGFALPFSTLYRNGLTIYPYMYTDR